MKGGARKGSGRKAGPPTATMTFKIAQTTLARLRSSVPRGRMTRFVEHALQRALDDAHLLTNKRKAHPTATRPCAACGMRRRANGHDPCIENLPVVRNACCGHGVDRGYVQFENGLVIRGTFRVDGVEYADGYYSPSSFAHYDDETKRWIEPGT
jgi:hypothetical protein